MVLIWNLFTKSNARHGFVLHSKNSILVTQLLLDPNVNVQHEDCDGWTLLLLLWASACNSVDEI
jgi:hypothetical protein